MRDTTRIGASSPQLWADILLDNREACLESASRFRDSFERIESALGRATPVFSYPYGGRDDYGTETVELVRRAGFSMACANLPGIVTLDSDRLQLPRIPVEDWSGEEFAHRLQGWFSPTGLN